MDPIFQELFQKVEKTLVSLEVIIKKPMDEDRRNVDATIQRFEFTIELFWKFLKNFCLVKAFQYSTQKTF